MIHYVGSCHCKAITYEINLPDDHFRAPPTSEYDFCIDCRRVAGSLLVRPDQAPELMLEDRMALPPRNPIEMAERRRQIDHVQVFTQRRKTILFDLWLSIHVQESGEESKIGKRRKARYYWRFARDIGRGDSAESSENCSLAVCVFQRRTRMDEKDYAVGEGHRKVILQIMLYEYLDNLWYEYITCKIHFFCLAQVLYPHPRPLSWNEMNQRRSFLDPEDALAEGYLIQQSEFAFSIPNSVQTNTMISHP